MPTLKPQQVCSATGASQGFEAGVKRRRCSQLSKKKKKSNYCSKYETADEDAPDSAWASRRSAKWTTVVIKKELKAPPVSTYCAAASETALAGMFSHNGRLKQLSITEPQKPPIPHPAPSLIVPRRSRAIPRLVKRLSRPEALTKQGFGGWMDGPVPSQRFHWRSRSEALLSQRLERRCLHLN